ncbi:sensor histidine kinase [Enterococcus sp. LJL128]|uniref:sensor histidine kinase n=1 Tax=Enterococcus sp. LJL51 TaxID=3416656 RepID=UPI003CEFAABF
MILGVSYFFVAVFFSLLEIVSICRFPDGTTHIFVSVFFFERKLFLLIAPDAVVVQNPFKYELSYSWILPGLFIIAISAVLLLFFRNIYVQQQLAVQQQREEELLEYVQTVESLTTKVRQRQHDFTNMLISLGSYIYEETENGELKRYFEKISSVNEDEYKFFAEMSKIKNLHIPELKALIYTKMMRAMEEHTVFDLEINKELHGVNMEMLDLVRILGILLDNALESAIEHPKPTVRMSIVDDGTSIIFIIANTTVNQKALSIIAEGTTTKGGYHGLGLSIVREILIKYEKRVFFLTEKKDDQIFQLFKVKKEGETNAH